MAEGKAAKLGCEKREQFDRTRNWFINSSQIICIRLTPSVSIDITYINIKKKLAIVNENTMISNTNINV